MTTYNRIMSGFLACLLGFPLSNQVSADELTLRRFMAPAPGVKNIYAGTDGIRLELTGFSDYKGTLEIQEKTIFPEELLPPNAEKR